MNLKKQYLRDTKQFRKCAYNCGNNFNEENFNKRIKIIINTKRSVPINGKRDLIIQYFIKLWRDIDFLSNSKSKYDKFCLKHILELAQIITINGEQKFGLAQKYFNLFMKDLWAWDKLPKKIEKFLHVPIDSLIFNSVRKTRIKKIKWTSWDINEDHCENTITEEYMEVQRIFRKQLKRTRFPKTIDFEQYLWHGFE